MSTILDFSSPLKESLFKKFQNKFLPWFIVNLKLYSKSLILQHCERIYFEFSRQNQIKHNFWHFWHENSDYLLAELFWALLSLTEIYLSLLRHIRICWVLLRFYWDFLTLAEFTDILLSFTKLSEFYWDFTEFYWDFTEFLLSCTEILLSFSEILLSFIEIYRYFQHYF